MQQPAAAPVRLRVGEFEVDLRCGEVRRNGDKIKLQQRPFQILVALLERPGDVVTRDEIRQSLWPTDTFVDFEHSINTAVKKLREALGDNAESPRFIETLPRYGYRLIAPVEIVEANGARLGTEVDDLSALDETAATMPAHQHRYRYGWAVGIAGFLVVLVAAGWLTRLLWRRSDNTSRQAWVQITHFSEGATSPALSPDGRMIAFIRGPETFVTPGQIYVKMLPNGEPVQLTHDDSPKMAPVFSPDGSRIAYTATDAHFGWNTWVVPILGGEPRELLPNAAALTWTDSRHVVFSEIKTGTHMGIVTAAENRLGERDVYLPEGWGMAHRSWVSPDGKWALISEMDKVGWRPCRVVSFDGSASDEIVGPPKARCTYAGWSPDGQTMYFSADAGDGFHIWRQRFPLGAPEQLTFGPTEEEGVAVSSDGRSLVTSAGIRESTVWIHDERGDRQISGEGFATVPGLGYGGWGSRTVFSPDGKRLFYLVQKQATRAYVSGELWVTNLESGQAEAVLPGLQMSEFDMSPDGGNVAFAALDADGVSHVWTAPIDRHSPPKLLTPSPARRPSFRREGEVYFLEDRGAQATVFKTELGDAVAHEVVPELDSTWSEISPQGDLYLVGFGNILAERREGGNPIHVCTSCGAAWGPGGKFFYLRFRNIGEMGGGKTIAILLPEGKELPNLPPSGFNSAEEVKGVNEVAEIDMKDKTLFAPGPNPSVYAYVRATVQRNLFRIPLD